MTDEERDEAIEILREIIDAGWLISDMDKCKAIAACERAITALQRNPCERTAKWVENPSADHPVWLCSKCGVGVGLRRTEKPRFIKYCPNCGAKMAESEG